MSLFRSLINKFWNKKPPEAIDFKGNHGILIKPDGTWSISNQQSNNTVYNPPTIIKRPPPPPVPAVPGKDYLYYDSSNELQVLSFPPDYFPHARELYKKLEQGLELDVLSSCTHKQSNNGVYILSVELPCGDNHTDSMAKFKSFVRAMEQSYNFTAIQQERINSITCSEKYLLVIFEYDPRKFFVKKIKDDKE